MKNGVILERKEEDCSSVFASNRRTVDLVKQAMILGGIAQKARREERQKQKQNLQMMLQNLYQQSRKTASHEPPISKLRVEQYQL